MSTRCRSTSSSKRSSSWLALRLGTEKRYELRKGRPDLNRLLDEYLGD